MERISLTYNFMFGSVGFLASEGGVLNIDDDHPPRFALINKRSTLEPGARECAPREVGAPEGAHHKKSTSSINWRKIVF